MKKFDGYLLVSDIDGTLADGQYVPPANIDAIIRFVDDGGQVVLATGRSPQSAVPVAQALGCSGMVIANNGALVYDIKRSQTVLQYTLDCLQITKEIIDRFEGVGALIYCGSDLCLAKNNQVIEYLIEDEKLTVKNSLSGSINKVIFGGNACQLDLIEQYCIGNPMLKGDLIRSGPTFIEILPTGVNKGSTMADLAKTLSIDSKKILVAGNYFNDVTMMKAAAISCAPSDSPDEVKKIADYVACTCREGAVAEFINYLYQQI